MTLPESRMRAALGEIPDAARRLLGNDGPALAMARALRERDPAVIVTAARGSSDCAAMLFKYGAELLAGVPVASLGPSIASIYAAPLRLGRGALLAISQSGRSPDILALVERAAAGGAVTLALVNDANSPLAAVAERVLPILAGPEHSVAATKTFTNSAIAALAVLAAWTGDAALAAALDGLPDRLAAALACDWSGALAEFGRADSLFVLGRGPGYAAALEAALKFKETAGLHAEAYSGAEVLHGPVALVRERFPVLVFMPQDEARAGLVDTVERLRGLGARVACIDAQPGDPWRLPAVATGHPLTDPLTQLVSFYGFVERLTRARGLDPDTHPHLSKVTRTR